MLREIHGVAADPTRTDAAQRRWFHDEDFDLFVWLSGGEVTLFQLCYGAGPGERALVWDKGRGFFHDGPPASRDVVERFDDLAVSLPEDIRNDIRTKIHEFAGRRLAVTARRGKFRRAAWQKSA